MQRVSYLPHRDSLVFNLKALREGVTESVSNFLQLSLGDLVEGRDAVELFLSWGRDVGSEHILLSKNP